MKVTVSKGIDQTLLEQNRQKKNVQTLSNTPEEDFAAVFASAQDQNNAGTDVGGEVSSSDVIFTGEPITDLIPPAEPTIGEETPIIIPTEPTEDVAASQDVPVEPSVVPEAPVTPEAPTVPEAPVVPEVPTSSEDTIVTSNYTTTTPASSKTTQSNVQAQSTAGIQSAAAQQSLAIDAAIANAKANGQAGIPAESPLAEALGITAPDEKSASSSARYHDTANRGKNAATNVTAKKNTSTTYDSAFSADLSAITAHYSKLSRADMGYDGTPAASYGGELECSAEMNGYFDEAARTYNVDVKLLKSMAKVESGFRADAVSRAGATGVMQLMPATARGLGVENALDARQNIMGGAKYIAAQLDKYNGDASLAVASYNAGGSKIDKYGGIPPYKETQNYVKKVLGYYEL